MKAKYDIPAIHAKCLEWYENPVFTYPWQQEYTLQRMVGGYCRIQDKHLNTLAILYMETTRNEHSQMMQFAHLIGIDVESYRIKETYKSAVERYLSTIGEGQPLWKGSPLTKNPTDGNTIYAGCDENWDLFTIWESEWEDHEIFSRNSYYFLRLDLNPDYQVEG